MEQKQTLSEFEYMRDLAELKALGNLSLEQPLTQEQYNKMISLAQKLSIIDGEWTT